MFRSKRANQNLTIRMVGWSWRNLNDDETLLYGFGESVAVGGRKFSPRNKNKLE